MGMLKNIFIYTLFLVVVDALLVMAFNIYAAPVLLPVLVITMPSIFILFTAVGISVSTLLTRKGIYTRLMITAGVVYLLIPIEAYYLFDTNSLLRTYKDLHFQFYLLRVLFLPYFLANAICIILLRKLKFPY